MAKQQVPIPNARQRLASNLRSLRAQHKLSQEALADLVGLHRTYVGSVERSERNVSLDNVERLAAALGVDIADLLSESPIERLPFECTYAETGTPDFKGRLSDRYKTASCITPSGMTFTYLMTSRLNHDKMHETSMKMPSCLLQHLSQLKSCE